MTETRKPPACHYDRGLGERVTRQHRDDCTNPETHQGCVPCTAPHCVVCGREHSTNDQPHTCPACQGRVDDDLADIPTLHAALRLEALDGARDGQLVAAAPIPGGTAAVLIGPTVRLDMMRTARGLTPRVLAEDHRRGDPVPPLAVLAQWEDMYRTWLDQPVGSRATLGRAVAYLRNQLPYIAQRANGPDFQAFTQQIRSLRSQLEHALHDEREPERGVECFECGDQLVRRFRDARRCRHSTPARDYFRQIVVDLGYPEHLTRLEVRAVRQPCGRCNQGGIDDPTAGLSWECPGCRKEYTPGEYSTAVRQDVLERNDGSGWCTVMVAADAAKTITWRTVTPKVVRIWVDRGEVAVRCPWRPGQRFGMQEVFWPDVLKRATKDRSRGRRAPSIAS